MPERTFISAESASRITLVSVSGLPDAQAAGWALTLSQAQMPGCKALLCSPVRPADLPESVEHLEIAPLDYQSYSWFMLFTLWRAVHTDFALVVQDDGWVLDGSLWRDEYLNYDYIGAPIHLAQVFAPEGDYWSQRFEWSYNLPEGHRAEPVLNGGFSLRSRKLMRVFEDHPQLRVQLPAPDMVQAQPLQFGWSVIFLNEDVQLSGLLRPQLEALGLKFPPLDVSLGFSIEYVAPPYLGMDAMHIFGHHARTRKLASLQPLTVVCPETREAVEKIYGEPVLMQMLEQRGYHVEYAQPLVKRRVYDCFTYNGEFEVLQTRLHELSKEVDCFVIVEATRTFAGDSKTLKLDLSAPELAPFVGRIRYVVVDDMPDDPPGVRPEDVVCDWFNDPPKTGFWLREKFQRNQIMHGLGDAQPDDLIMVSDADEIPRANAVRWMSQQPFDKVFGLELRLYYFYANYRNVEGTESNVVWSAAAPCQWLEQGTPDQLRMGVRTGKFSTLRLQDAGWHLSYLGMDEEQVQRKIRGFAHQEYNNADFLQGMDLKAIVRSGRDIYGREGYRWSSEAKDDAPVWLQEQVHLAHLFID